MELYHDILLNELLWLESIGCKINRTQEGIVVEREEMQTTDFNFFIPFYGITENKCIRLSVKSQNYLGVETCLFSKSYIYEKSFDINFIACSPRSEHNVVGYELKEVDYSMWNTNNEKRGLVNECKYYYILHKDTPIGKVNIIKSNNITGIYDFEIFSKYQNMGYGSGFLKQFISENKGYFFIQTWSDNLSAIKSYIKAGFRIYDNLYRFVKRGY